MRILALALLAAVAVADEPTKSDVRRLANWSKLDTIWKRLAPADGVEIGEGQRGMRDVFPYWAAKRGDTTYAVTPKNIAHFLEKKDGAVVSGGFAALELVRMFVPGFVVDWNDTADAVVAEARKLKAEGVAVTVHDYRPKSYSFQSQRVGEVWRVSLVALEIVGRLRLVHVTATVDPAGALTFERKAIVDGPALTWQTEGDVDVEADRKARERVHNAMLRCAAAAAGVPTPRRAWVLARAMDRLDDVTRVFGKPAKDSGTPLRTVAFVMRTDDSTVRFSGPAGEGRITSVRHLFTVYDGGKPRPAERAFRRR